MRELITNEIHQVAGGDFIQDLKDIYQNGIDSSELTVGILSISTGMLMGSLMPKIAPICGLQFEIGQMAFTFEKQQR